ncbi:MAG: hypothetical protein HY919_06660 [Elusimicrobia bacterium]|nr:hypothetical protein [Elusimicrobiota bacterium]
MTREALLAGLISGIISPMIVSFIQHKCIWKSQKRLEIKYSIFNDAVRALSLNTVDALSPEIQNNKVTYQGAIREVERKPETWELIEKSRSMVRAFYSKETSEKFEKAIKTKISIENIPNTEYEINRTEAIIALSKEIGIR